MKRKLSMLALLSFAAIAVSSCNNSQQNSTPSTSGSENTSVSASDSTTVDSSTAEEPSYVFEYPEGVVDGWNGLDYYNLDPQLKNVAKAGTAENFVEASYEDRAEILGLLEEYAMKNNLTGLVLYDDGGYGKYSSRIQFPTNPLKDANGNPVVVAGTTRYDYVTGYGFGVVSEGKLNGHLTKRDGTPVENAYPDYYHTYEGDDPKTLNYMNDKGSVVGNYHGYVAGGYFSTKLNAAKDGYEWFASMASDANEIDGVGARPLPLESFKEDGSAELLDNPTRNTLSSAYRIYVRTGADAVYALASQNDTVKSYNGQQVVLDDYLTPYKEMHNQSNAMARGAESLEGAGSIKGMAAYYEATKNGFDQAAWDEVCIATGTDSKGSYLDFEFNVPCTPFYAMYYLSSSLYAPLPASYIEAIGGIKNWGSFVDGGSGDYKFTPVDTTLSTGPYVVEKWAANSEFVFKKNELLSDEINGGSHRYQIPGIYVNVMPSTKTDTTAAFTAWENGLIDACGIPTAKVESEVNASGTQQTRGGSTTKLNINTCDQETWEELFGENGSITQTEKENYWEVKPAMSNENFIKGINLAINRKEYAEKRGVTPSISYFADAYLSNPEDGYSYNLTQEHQDALLSYYGSEAVIKNYGYDLDLATAYFKAAAAQLLASGAYKEGDTIKIELCWQAQAQVESAGADIKKYIEDAFNNKAVCDNKLTLEIENTFVTVWSDIYYAKMMVGQYDIALGGISGNTLNPLNFMEVLKSDNSSGFTLNWGTHTNSTEQLIDYNGKKWTYDALWAAADHGTLVSADGSNAILHDAVIVANEYNDEDGTRTITVKYAGANTDGSSVTINRVELWWYENPEDPGYAFKVVEHEELGDGYFQVTIDAETAASWLGEISLDIVFDTQVGDAEATETLTSVYSAFVVEEAEA